MRKGLLISVFTLIGVLFAASAYAGIAQIDSTITDSAGKALSGAYVQVIQSSDSLAGAPSTSTGLPAGETVVDSGTTDSNGKFQKVAVSISKGEYVYIRAWDTWKGTGTPTGNYGTGAAKQVPIFGGILYTESVKTDKSITTTPAPVIGISPASISFSANEGSNPTTKTGTVTLSNTGNASLTTWTGGTITYTGGKDNWISTSKSSGGPIAAAGSDTFTVTAGDVSAFTAGTYTATIPLSFSQSIASKNVTVNLTITKQGIPPATSIVIDDFEGSAVDPSTGYYEIIEKGESSPTYARQTSVVHEKSNAMSISYGSSTVGYRGWGGVLNSTVDITSYDTITFMLRGDGSTTGKVKIQINDKDGDNFYAGSTYEFSLSDSSGFKKFSVPISAFTNRMASGSAAGSNGSLDKTQIAQYQVVFTGKEASKGNIYVDYVIATKESVTPTPTSDAPSIISISPAKAKTGDPVTITGVNFGTAGKVEFTGTQSKTYIESTGNSAISQWDSKGTLIKFNVPAGLSGKLDVKVYSSSNTTPSNSVTFEVTAQATGTGSYNYPNPFNPNGGESTTIVFDSGTDTSATIYIFNTAAEMVEKLSWTGTAGSATVTWNGKNAYGETLGDGAYLYRVAAGSKLIAKGKILVVNK